MSMPSRGTTFGEIEINGETYKIFSRPLSDEIVEKIHKYKTDGAGISTSASWMTDTYKWSIVDNKLYLNEMNILSFDQELYEKLMAEAGEELIEKGKHHSKTQEVNEEPIEEDTRSTKKLIEDFKNGVPHSSDRTLEEIGAELKVDKSRVFQINSQVRKNMIQELFNTDKLFAEWQNKDIKLLIKQEIHHCEIAGRKDHIIRNSRVLKFKDGVLIATNDEVEEFAQGGLKNYIEE